MKKYIIMASLLLAVAGGAHGQNIYDAAKIAQTDLTGTARFVGMSGAMSALGGDISTIGTNPAGIGIFRSNDLSASMGFTALGVESNYGGAAQKLSNSRVTFDQFGFVLSNKIGNETALRYVNFGFNYHRANEFRRGMTMQGTMQADEWGRMSQVRQMAEQANDMDAGVNLTAQDVFTDSYAGWLGALGANTYLLEFPSNVNGNLYVPYIPSDPLANFRLSESGGVDVYDFNVSFNVNDRAYFGLSIGAYDVTYNRYTEYSEDYTNGEGYTLQSWNTTSGAGFDFKLGTIFRPFENSPLRIGLAVHTPTFYNLKLATNARLASDWISADDGRFYTTTVDTYDEVDGNMHTEFRITTPWKFNGSLGYTIGSAVALGAEYEYQDYSTMSFEEPGGYRMEYEKNEAKANLRGVHALRVGVEVKPTTTFALRAGYNLNTALFNADAHKFVPSNSIQTDTDWSNSAARHGFTFGLGYRGNNFYADLAYAMTTQKSDFYPFRNDFYDDNSQYLGSVSPAPTKVTDTRHRVVFTLGFRF
jgi:hypothetical protein